jgi:hypothetical protein
MMEGFFGRAADDHACGFPSMELMGLFSFKLTTGCSNSPDQIHDLHIPGVYMTLIERQGIFLHLHFLNPTSSHDHWSVAQRVSIAKL